MEFYHAELACYPFLSGIDCILCHLRPGCTCNSSPLFINFANHLPLTRKSFQGIEPRSDKRWPSTEGRRHAQWLGPRVLFYCACSNSDIWRICSPCCTLVSIPFGLFLTSISCHVLCCWNGSPVATGQEAFWLWGNVFPVDAFSNSISRCEEEI